REGIEVADRQRVAAEEAVAGWQRVEQIIGPAIASKNKIANVFFMVCVFGILERVIVWKCKTLASSH
ncbi:MAG TPA: hypothetical protein PLI34_18055, partial [Saprospiraceae bacterium]|nr:hypothetical protein [Saprospiraceae bacterium]